jgi:TolB protein
MGQDVPHAIATSASGWFQLSPDHSEILFLQRREGNIADREYDVTIVDVVSLEQYRITDNGVNYAPIWSPSGNQVAFVRETENEYEIIVKATSLESDEGSVYRSEGFISSISWSSNGDYIAFVQCLTEYECDVFLLNTTSDKITNVTNDFTASVLEIAWSPDSSELAFIAYVNDDLKNTDIYVMDIETSQITPFGFGLAEYKHIEWSANGEVIAFASDLDGDWDIYLITLDTMKSLNPCVP